MGVARVPWDMLRLGSAGGGLGAGLLLA